VPSSCRQSTEPTGGTQCRSLSCGRCASTDRNNCSLCVVEQQLRQVFLPTQGSWKQAADYGLSPALSPTWRVALLSDGSVTRHLQLMTGDRVETVSLLLRVFWFQGVDADCRSSCQMAHSTNTGVCASAGSPRPKGHRLGHCWPARERRSRPWAPNSARGVPSVPALLAAFLASAIAKHHTHAAYFLLFKAIHCVIKCLSRCVFAISLGRVLKLT
jgi:hypothetical protein